MRRRSPGNRDAIEEFLANATHSRLEVAWELLTLGLRVGEVLGLRWADIDATAGLITVRHAVAGVPYSALALPAAAPRERVIDARHVLDALDRHHRRQEAARSEWGSEYHDEGPLVCGVDGRPLHPRALHRAFSQAVVDAGLPALRLSDLRRSHPAARSNEQVPAMRGHIRKRGSTWAVVVDVGRDANGTRRQKWHSGFRTKREANEALTEILGQLATGQYVVPSKLTVGRFLVDEWLPAIRASVRPLTFESYAGNVRNHVVPRLGSVPVQKLTPSRLNAMYAELGETLSPRTVRYIHAILRRAFADAVKWNRIARNPIDAADPPSPRAGSARVMSTWSSSELARFLERAGDDRLSAC